VSSGCAAGEEGRIPHRAENAETGGARYKETETIESMTDIDPTISERDDSDGAYSMGARRDSNDESR